MKEQQARDSFNLEHNKKMQASYLETLNNALKIVNFYYVLRINRPNDIFNANIDDIFNIQSTLANMCIYTINEELINQYCYLLGIVKHKEMDYKATYSAFIFNLKEMIQSGYNPNPCLLYTSPSPRD